MISSSCFETHNVIWLAIVTCCAIENQDLFLPSNCNFTPAHQYLYAVFSSNSIKILPNIFYYFRNLPSFYFLKIQLAYNNFTGEYMVIFTYVLIIYPG
jgi:hypothetical protein